MNANRIGKYIADSKADIDRPCSSCFVAESKLEDARLIYAQAAILNNQAWRIRNRAKRFEERSMWYCLLALAILVVSTFMGG